MNNQKSDVTPKAATPAGAQLHSGGCHCGAVRYQVSLDASQGSRCNCSICTKVSQIGGLVKPAAFELLAGRDSITEYSFGPASQRSFCKRCGIHCFGAGHVVELGGDFVSVNLNTLDDIEPIDVKVVYWDGRHDNWQAGPSERPWRIKA